MTGLYDRFKWWSNFLKGNERAAPVPEAAEFIHCAKPDSLYSSMRPLIYILKKVSLHLRYIIQNTLQWNEDITIIFHQKTKDDNRFSKYNGHGLVTQKIHF